MELKLISILFKGKKTLIYSLEFNINIVDIIVNYLLSYLYCAYWIILKIWAKIFNIRKRK